MDVLVLVEDPGAANYLAALPPVLEAAGVRTALLARGPAEAYLRARGIAFAPPPDTLAESDARLLIAGTAQSADALGLRLIVEARARGIATAAAVDARMNAPLRFRGHGAHPLACAPDWLLVVDEWTGKTFSALGFPHDRVLVCGHPQFDRVRQAKARFAGWDRHEMRRELFPRAPAARPVIVFAAEPLLGHNARDGFASSRPERALEWLLAAAPQTWVALRPHPKTLPEEFAGVPRVADPDGLRVAFAADLVAGLTSTYLVEACLLGTPTLSIVMAEAEREWLPTIEAGITPCAASPEEVRNCLAEWCAGRGAMPAKALDRLAPPGALERITGFVCRVLSG